MTHASSWRRWDPHIHAPGTSRNDGFGGDWHGYVEAINTADPPVVALGVTDYCSIRCYRDVKDRWDRGELPGVNLIFPNIEFRLSHQTSKDLPLNIHLLISPDETDHVERIEEALSRLTPTFKQETVPATREGLIRLGRTHGSQELDDEAAYRVGAEQFKVDRTEFAGWLSKEYWLSRHALVVVAGGNDGLAGVRRDSGFKAVHDELVRLSNLVFSATPSDRDYFLGLGADNLDELSALFGGPRACLHGCDAHEINQVLQPDLERYCWIKADPTFSGLRQVLFEPADRVHIGSEPPSQHDPDQVISTIRIRDTDGWFEEEKIRMSEGLNAVIGEKGSGKTAFLDLIAAAAGAWDAADSGSFLAKARGYLENATVSVMWASGRRGELPIGILDEQARTPSVRYLSQHFVERLCSGQTLSHELLREIERVIFDYIPVKRRRRTTSFDELKRRETHGLQTERSELVETVGTLNATIAGYRREILEQPRRRGELDAARAEARRLDGEIKSLLAVEQHGDQDALEALRKRQGDLERQVAGAEDKLARLDEVERKLGRLKRAWEETLFDVRTELRDIGLGEADLEAFAIQFKGETSTPLVKLRGELRDRVRLIEEGRPPEEAGPTEATFDTIASLEGEIEVAEAGLRLDTERRERVESLQEGLDEQNRTAQALEDEIARVTKLSSEDLPEAEHRRLEAYRRLFELLEEEREVLERLYGPLDEELTSRVGAERELDFKVTVEVDASSFLRTGESLFDFRKSAWFCRTQAIEQAMPDELSSGWDRLDGEAIVEGVTALIAKFDLQEVENSLTKRATLKSFLDWIFSASHVKLQYTIEYQGTALRYLSPGTRGIVLLILYLGIDGADTRPILIDQPEENLDNASVFDILVKYFRDAKRKRQVILVTHNPNLVVNTDAECIIVASASKRQNELPKIQYRLGPIEGQDPRSDTPIKQRICSILEGGEAAFLMRERRYELSR